MLTTKMYPGHENALPLEHRDVFQAALMMHWNPDESVQDRTDENERAMAWIKRYGAVYAEVYRQFGSELLVGSAKNPAVLAKWQHTLDERLRSQALAQDLAKHQPLD